MLRRPTRPRADRTKLLKSMKGLNSKARGDAMEELAGWVDTDPESVAALLELLKDRTTTGAGKVLPTQINSTREAAATTLLWGGAKGEAALKDKGFAILREGLNDRDPVIREHTAYTIGKLGAVASPLSPDVMKLCNSSDADVRAAAFEALDFHRYRGRARVRRPDQSRGPGSRQAGGTTSCQSLRHPRRCDSTAHCRTRQRRRIDSPVRGGWNCHGRSPGRCRRQGARRGDREVLSARTQPDAAVRARFGNGLLAAPSKIGADAVGPTTDLLVHKNLFVRALLRGRLALSVRQPNRRRAS